MIFRKALPRDRAQIIRIWGDVFGDTADVTNRLLDDFAGFDNIYVAESEGKVVSQLLAVPCECGGQKGAYLYALATVSEFRRRGVMERLMDYVQAKVKAAGGSFFILIPASRSLFDYYEARKFNNIYMQNIELDDAAESELNVQSNDFESGEIPADLFSDIRSRFIEGDVVTFNKAQTALELEEQWYYGCFSLYCGDGYAIYLKVDDTLFVTEVAAGEDLALNLISSAQKLTGCTDVRIALPANSSLLDNSAFTASDGSAKKTPQAQYRWWGAGDPPDFYLRFALDDLPARIQANYQDIIV